MAGSLKVWWGSGSGPSWKVLLAVEEKKIPYKSNLISFANKENKTAEFLKMNPRGKVPTIQHGDFSIYESSAIIRYLDVAFPQNPLYPSDLQQRALVEMRTAETDNLGTANRLFAPYIFAGKPYDKTSTEALDAAKKLKEELAYWNNYIKPGSFIVGNSISAADVSLYPYIATMERYGITYKSFPNIQQWSAKMASRDSVKKTYPPHWKEKPSTLKLEDV